MAEFKPSTWQQPVQDIVKEYNEFDKAEHHQEVQTAPEDFSKSLVRRGLLNPMTGMPINNSKQRKITQDNARGFSPLGKANYERIFGHS